MRHVNIPVFIPHLGCPNQCVFCNQREISGVREFKAEDVIPIIDSALGTVEADAEVEIAFFGGSFTGIDRVLMNKLLTIAYAYVEDGRVSGIRCSTRPDYINSEILCELKKYGVKVIELGLQSIDERVLLETKRGHTFSAEKEACRLIVEAGFTLVGQMMIGLPGADVESELKTADFIISSGASGARIYPTVVFKDTDLCKMAQSGEYKPLSLDEAVRRSAKVMTKFIDAGVEVIRVGLCSSENLVSEQTYYAGPNHAALGELVENEIYYNMICTEIEKTGISDTPELKIYVPIGSLSKAIGQKKKNKIKLQEKYNIKNTRFSESAQLSGYSIMIER